MKTLLLGFMLFFFPQSLWAVECRAVSIQEFREATKSGPDRIIFFASWCSSCARFVTPERMQDSIFVAAADDKVKAEKVLTTYLKDRAAAARCFFDKDDSIAKAFGVRNLPMEKSLRDLPQP